MGADLQGVRVDAVISAISAERTGVVLILWGGEAQKKARLIDLARHPAPITTQRAELQVFPQRFEGGHQQACEVLRAAS